MCIDGHLENYELDVRKTGDARFMDQKVTPDVLCLLADCVLNHVADRDIEFTKDDIWNDDYFNVNVKGIFNKPDAQNATTRQEYDKLTSQPLRTLAYAGVLSFRKESRKNVYSVNNNEILEYIGLKERNAYIFLYKYLTKLLSDSNLLRHFDAFRKKCEDGSITKNDFTAIKTRFQRFIIGNTAINGTTEVNRIFPKVLNVYSCENNIQGTIKGRLSGRQIYYTDLMYNRPNWRDGDKNKAESRNEAMEQYEDMMTEQQPAYADYQIQKTMNVIRRMYNQSEIRDQWANGDATQVHHIFPRAQYPTLAHYPENLIKLTPTQHYTKAHPNNATQEIDPDYQLVCLLAKADSINRSVKQGQIVYRKESFIQMLNAGLNVDMYFDLPLSRIKKELRKIYNNR